MQRGSISRLESKYGRGYLVPPRFGAVEIRFETIDVEGCDLDQLRVGNTVDFERVSDWRGVRAVHVRLTDD